MGGNPADAAMNLHSRSVGGYHLLEVVFTADCINIDAIVLLLSRLFLSIKF